MKQPTTFPYTPILGWSASRYDTFSLCKRRYYYHYYAKFDPEFSRERIDALKGLSSIPLAIGGSTHAVIETLLGRLQKTSQDIDRPRFLDHARAATQKLVQETRFHEVVYGERVAVTVEDVFPKVELCLTNLLASDRYQWLVGEAIHSSQHWVIDPPGYGETRMEDMKVYFKVDFLFPVGENWHILDWKTGQPDAEKHRKQLAGYSMWAVFHLGVEPDAVRAALAYLQPEYREEEEVFSAQDLENFGVQVRAETKEMHAYCRDVAQNIPRDKADFPRIDHERICPHCEYRGLCFPEQYPLRG